MECTPALHPNRTTTRAFEALQPSIASSILLYGRQFFQGAAVTTELSCNKKANTKANSANKTSAAASATRCAGNSDGTDHGPRSLQLYKHESDKQA